jgi:hypothetical protein
VQWQLRDLLRIGQCLQLPGEQHLVHWQL